MNPAKLNKLSSVILILFIIWNLIVKILIVSNISPGLLTAIDLLLMGSFFIFHGLQIYSVKEIIIFFISGFVISNIIENIGVATGFPFGHYHHTEILGPKLFLIPISVGPSYIFMGYISWMTAHTLLGIYDRDNYKEHILALPLVASFVLASWDLCFDAAQSTLFKVWFWENGGPHFGVPFENYLGWLLLGFVFYFSFTLYISGNSSIKKILSKSFWYQPVLFYGTVSLGLIILFALIPGFPVKDETGKEWFSSDVLQSLIITNIFTMGFVTMLSIFRLRSKN